MGVQDAPLARVVGGRARKEAAMKGASRMNASCGQILSRVSAASLNSASIANVSWVIFVCLSLPAFAQQGRNLIDDPSFEIPKERDQFGIVFAKWGGWKYEGDCRFEVGQVAHTGAHSCLLVGGAGAKIRSVQLLDLEPGRYRITAWLRGLDIGTGAWNWTTEFMFNGKYMQLKKNGTFGWTKLTYVADVNTRKKAGPSFGMFAPGYFWIDDVSVEKVGVEVPLTVDPILGPEEAPIAPPGEIVAGAIRCPQCAYRNMPAWKTCYACGSALKAPRTEVAGPPVKSIASFENRSPFDGGEVVIAEKEHGAGKRRRRPDSTGS